MDEKRCPRQVGGRRAYSDDEQNAAEVLHPGKSATILIADGDSKARQFLRDLLTKEGFGVIEVGDGMGCLAKTSERHPDLVLLAARMPDEDGKQVLSKLRRISTVPVIMLIEPYMEREKVDLLESGADSCVMKPFRSGELVARMRALLRRLQSSWRSVY